MQIPSVKILNGAGGLGRPPAGQDHISGLVDYFTTLPSGFDSSNRIKKVNSLPAAVALGINFDFTDGTAGTGTIQFTALGANGDTVAMKHTNVKGEVVDLGTFTKDSTHTTLTLEATAAKNIINAGTNVHGYTATSSTDTVTVTVPKFNGVYAGVLATTIVGTITTTVVQVTGGAKSPIAALYYHISEFFRKSPNGELYVSCQDSAYGTNFVEVKDLVDFAEGRIRQVGVMNNLTTAFATTQIAKIQAQCDACFTNNRPIVALFAPEITGTASLSSLPDLSGLDSELVATVISQDLGGVGGWLALSLGKSLSDLGAKLGTLASSRVSDSWAWVAQYNMTDGTELNTVGFSNGVSLATAENLGILNQLTSYAYCFLRKITDYVGTFNNQPNTATLESSDYRFLYLNRTIQKAGRLEKFAMTPFESSPVVLKPNGELSDLSIETFKSAIGQQLDIMVRDGELSNYLVTIDPAQLILQTNKVAITVKLQPVGVADFIEVTNQFTLKITA